MVPESRRLFTPPPQPESVVPETLTLAGGTLSETRPLLIDGTLREVAIVCTDFVHVSSLARLENCTLQAPFALIEGVFSGSIEVARDCEVTASAQITGDLNVGGDVLIDAQAAVEGLAVRMRRTLSSHEGDSTVQIAAAA